MEARERLDILSRIIQTYPREALACLLPEEIEGLLGFGLGQLALPEPEPRVAERQPRDCPSVALGVFDAKGTGPLAAYLFVLCSPAVRCDPFRLGHVCLSLSERYLSMAILPVVVPFDTRVRQASLMFPSGVLGRLPVECRVRQLGLLPAADYLASPNLFTRLMLPLMASPDTQVHDRALFSAMAAIEELEPSQERRALCYAFLAANGWLHGKSRGAPTCH